jgi:two-component system sensor histidine kinase VanS
LKNELIWNKPYNRLIRKVFLQTLAILTTAIGVILLLRSAGKGYIGNAITRFIMRLTRLSWEDARLVYVGYIGSNMETIMTVTIILSFIVLLRFSLNWFTKYFDEIIAGVDQLSEEQPYRIQMSPELGFVEAKLNQVRDKLEKRAKIVQEAEQRKNDLVLYLAHDIKTPLTSVIGYLNLVEENPDMPPEQKAKYLHITLDKACRLEELINEFFEITRYNLQTVPLKKESIDLYYMLLQMADEAYPQLSVKGKEVVLHVPEEMMIYGDSDKLARVFNNVLKNAIAYSGSGGIIDISAEVRRTEAIIRFKNEGSIRQDRLKLIFEKFYRLDDARSSATGGAGLGLAIAQDIIRLHGGAIAADSSQTHTVFTITLPNSSGDSPSRS